MNKRETKEADGTQGAEVDTRTEGETKAMEDGGTKYHNEEEGEQAEVEAEIRHLTPPVEKKECVIDAVR